MKSYQQLIIAVLLLCVWPTTIQSQQMYRIHLDNVKPSMVAEYEQISKEFIEACEEHSPAVKWITSVTKALNKTRRTSP